VSCLCPGPVRTGFADRAGMDDQFFSGAMSAERVVQAGLDGLARNRRRVVPGWLNKVQAVASSWVPSGIALRVTEAVMARAG
ncbi:MAG: SDR family NAD(P)-dependent oxidoreductase, partial [Bacteroidota bacterium]